jgi:hypothetical protein
METFDRPLSDFDARQLKNKNFFAMRGTRIPLWLTEIRFRRQFGEGFIFGKNSPQKNRTRFFFSV